MDSGEWVAPHPMMCQNLLRTFGIMPERGSILHWGALGESDPGLAVSLEMLLKSVSPPAVMHTVPVLAQTYWFWQPFWSMHYKWAWICDIFK